MNTQDLIRSLAAEIAIACEFVPSKDTAAHGPLTARRNEALGAARQLAGRLGYELGVPEIDTTARASIGLPPREPKVTP